MASEESREIGAVCDFTVVPSLIHGLRRWQLYKEGESWRLGALSTPMIWAPGETARATCVNGDFLDDEPPTHDAPGFGCSCGIYAFHPFGEMAEAFEEDVGAPEPGYARSVGWPVCGAISAWGRVEVHSDGFRAEFARPAALFVGSDWADSHYGAVLRDVAAEYALPLIEFEDGADLLELCRERWPGLSQDLVEELLIDEHEVTLVPATHALMPRRGETIAGAGYLIEGERYKPWLWDHQWPVDATGLRVVRVAGTRFSRATLQGPEFAPLQPVRLVPEPDNPHDPNAVAIYDGDGRKKAGYVPRDLAFEVVRDLEADRVGQALVAWQWRSLANGERVGLCVLIPRRRLPITVCTDSGDEEVITVSTEVDREP